MDRTKQDRISIDQTTISLLSIIRRDADGLLFILFRHVPGHTRWASKFYARLPHLHDGLSMMSTAIFSFPVVLHTDKINNWQKTLRHTPVNMVEYYLSKITSMMVDYLVSILVVFSVGHFVRGVDMPLGSWIGAALLLIVGSVAFVALGLTLTLLPSSQLMSVVGNLLYLGLAVLGGLWMPISLFPRLDASNRKVPTNLSVDGVAQDLLKRGWHQFISHSLSTCFFSSFVWFDHLPSRS